MSAQPVEKPQSFKGQLGGARPGAGRKSKYDPDFHPNEVIKCGEKGYSIAQMSSHFDIGRQTLTDWVEQHSEFREAFARAKEHSQACWENWGESNTGNKGFNAQMWLKAMSARFKEDYTERKEVKQEVKTENISEEPRDIARALLNTLGAQGLEALRSGLEADSKEQDENKSEGLTH